MAGEFDGIGEAVSGAMIARAVEPSAGEADGHTHEAVCLNCGSPLAGPFCTECGQKAHLHRTISAFFHDVAHGVLHFEGKTWRTLPMLAWRPGELTRRYIDGERAKFVSPMALFLFSVFLMFALVSWVGGPVNFNANEIDSGMQTDVAEKEEAVRNLEAKRAAIVAAGGSTQAIDQQVADARKTADLEKAIAKDGIRGAAMRVSDDVPAWLAEPLRRGAQNPQLLFYKIQNNAYKFSWALIPLSLPFLWLLFPFSRKFRLYDHMVFVTYSLSFMTLLVCAGAIAATSNASALIVVAMLYVPFHIYRQLRGTYDLGRISAILRTFAVGIFAFIALALFAMLMFALGFI